MFLVQFSTERNGREYEIRQRESLENLYQAPYNPPQPPLSALGNFLVKHGLSRNTAGKIENIATWVSIVIGLSFLIYLSLNGPGKKINKDGISFEKLFSNRNEFPFIVWYTEAPWRFRNKNRVLQCPFGSRSVFCATSSNISLGLPHAYLFYGPKLNFSDLPLPRRPDILWGLFTDETPKHKLQMLHEKALNLFNFSSTFSRFSNVPIPLTWLLSGLWSLKNRNYWIPTEMKNKLLGNNPAVIYIQSTCDVSTERDEYVQELKKYIPIASFGKCVKWSQRNTSIGNELFFDNTFQSDEKDDFLLRINEIDSFQILAKYKFMIIIDSEVCSDFVSEKVWRALFYGVVPIYFGSPTIRNWLPNPESAVLIEDFPTPKLLADHLNMLLRNDTAYDKHLVHKTEGVILNKRLHAELFFRPYQTDILDSIMMFECYVCNKLHMQINQSRPEVNIMTKKQYNCSQYTSVLSLYTTTNHTKLAKIEEAKKLIDVIYETSQKLQKNMTTA